MIEYETQERQSTGRIATADGQMQERTRPEDRTIEELRVQLDRSADPGTRRLNSENRAGNIQKP